MNHEQPFHLPSVGTDRCRLDFSHVCSRLIFIPLSQTVLLYLSPALFVLQINLWMTKCESWILPCFCRYDTKCLWLLRRSFFMLLWRHVTDIYCFDTSYKEREDATHIRKTDAKTDKQRRREILPEVLHDKYPSLLSLLTAALMLTARMRKT